MELAILYSLLIFAVMATVALFAILGLMPSKDDVRETCEAVRVINAQLKQVESAAGRIESKLAEIKIRVESAEELASRASRLIGKFESTTELVICDKCHKGTIEETKEPQLLTLVREALGKKR